MMPLHRALFYMMESSVAYKASTYTKEQIGVIWDKASNVKQLTATDTRAEKTECL
jgi:hypothetical protein